MGFWLTFFLFVGSFVVGELIRPRPKNDSPQPSGLGDINLPTADATRVIPIVYGTVLLRGPNTVWYGDLDARPIKQKVRTSLFSSSEVTIGYRYYLGMQMVLCHGILDVIRGIRFEEKIPVITTSTVGDALRIDLGAGSTFNLTSYAKGPNRNLFGGEGGAGGVGGPVDVYLGTNGQAPNDYLQSRVLSTISGYPHVAYAVFRRCYLGNSPYLKAPAFEVSRYPNGLGLGAGKHIIATYDANPACALYDLYTNDVYGLGKPSSEFDLASFLAAGDTLHAEGFGISLNVDTVRDAKDVIEEIERHIDAIIYRHPTTGLRTLKLARKDYTVGTLPVLDETSVEDVELARPSWDELVGNVMINYISRTDGYTKRPVQHPNLAVIQIHGGRVVTEQIDFLCVSRATIAQAIAARTSKTLSYPLARVRVTANRKAWSLPPGAVFVLNWAPLGITGMVLRVIEPDLGGLEEGVVVLDCVEDIFAIATTAYSAPGGSGWVDPSGTPAAAAAETLIEAPYHLVGSADRHVLAVAARATGAHLGYEIHSDRAGGTTYLLTATSDEFAPTGLLTASYAASTAAQDATGFTVGTAIDIEQLVSITQEEMEGGVNLCLIDSEILGFRTVTDNGDGTWTFSQVLRGLLDTVPAAHSSAARVWILRPIGAAIVDPENPYPADGNVRAKLLPSTTRGVLDIASAAALLITTASRAQKPYPPGNVKIAGVAWPTSVTGGVDIAVTWAHRHRVNQYTDLRMVAQDAASYAAAPEGDYTIEVRVGGVLKRTVSALTGTTWTWTAAMQTADAATVGTSVEIRVIPKNGALTGTYQTRTFTIA